MALRVKLIYTCCSSIELECKTNPFSMILEQVQCIPMFSARNTIHVDITFLQESILH